MQNPNDKSNPQNEAALIHLQESILLNIQAGSIYEGLEKFQIFIRQMKKNDKIQDGLIFLIRIALILLENGHSRDASVAAYRSIAQFPSDATTIRIVLKQLYLAFAEKATADAVCPELFKYFKHLAFLFNDQEETLLCKQALLASETKNFYRAQLIYLDLLAKYSNKIINNIDVDSYIQKIDDALSQLSELLWNWIKQQEKYGREHQRNISQFIFARCILTLLTSKGNDIIEMAQKLTGLFQSSVPDFIEFEDIFQLPLFHFADYFIKALDQKSAPTIDYLIKKYRPVLNTDLDIIENAQTAKTVHLSRGNPYGGLGSMVQNLLDRMMNGQ